VTGTSRSSTPTNLVSLVLARWTSGSRQMSGRIPPTLSRTDQLRLSYAVVSALLFDKPLAGLSKFHAKPFHCTFAKPKSDDSQPPDGTKVMWVSNKITNIFCNSNSPRKSGATKIGNSMVMSTSKIFCSWQIQKCRPKSDNFILHQLSNKFDGQSSVLRGVIEVSAPSHAGLPNNVRIVGLPTQQFKGRSRYSIISMKTQFPTGTITAVTVESMPPTKLGHYAFSKARRVTQEASRVQMTVWNRKFVSIYICINVHNFPQNNYCPFILS
jgi:hypothetical protein